MAGSNDLTLIFVVFSLLISQAQGDTKDMLQKALDNFKNTLNTKN